MPGIKSRSRNRPLPHPQVGIEYQAEVPPVMMSKDCGRMEKDYEEKASQVWSWSHCAIEDTDLDNYEQRAVHMYGFTREQALSRLFFHKFKLGQAIKDLAIFKSEPSEWSDCDKRRFEDAFKLQGKNFELIQKMMPEKTIKSLVGHYFSRERAVMQNLYSSNVDLGRRKGKKSPVLKPMPSLLNRRNSKRKVNKYRNNRHSKHELVARNSHRSAPLAVTARAAVRNFSNIIKQKQSPPLIDLSNILQVDSDSEDSSYARTDDENMNMQTWPLVDLSNIMHVDSESEDSIYSKTDEKILSKQTSTLPDLSNILQVGSETEDSSFAGSDNDNVTKQTFPLGELSNILQIKSISEDYKYARTGKILSKQTQPLVDLSNILQVDSESDDSCYARIDSENINTRIDYKNVMKVPQQFIDLSNILSLESESDSDSS